MIAARTRTVRSLLAVAVALALALLRAPAAFAAAPSVELGSERLSVEQVVAVSRANAEVSVPADAMSRVDAGHDLVLKAALQNIPVYGLTVGVGQNKDRPIFKEVNGQRVLSDEVLEVSRQFNRTSLRAHAAGVGAPLPADVVRAGMLIRLNNLLSGACGAQSDVARQYVEFLNKGVVPVVPSSGTVGEADITLASHIGLVMVGEWEAFYDGERMSGADALDAAGVEPLHPVGKDFLCIISNNGLVVGEAALATHDAEQYLRRAATVFALSLEGLNGNIAPFLEATTAPRPFPGMVEAAGLVRDAIDGSSLWTAAEKRALQDPLSYRDMAYTLGNTLAAVHEVEQMISIHMNSTEDNPMVVIGPTGGERPGSTQIQRYLLGGDTPGAIYPTANFEPLPVVAAVERLSLALGILSDAFTMNILRLVEPDVTHLSRFLAAPGNTGHSFGAVQKAFVALNTENRTLAMPVSLNSVAVAGNIEDRATHSQFAVRNLGALLGNLYQISSFQLLHATQAVDLREGFILGDDTKKLHAAYREVVPFVDQDRIFTTDVARGVELLRGWPVAGGAPDGTETDFGIAPRGGVASGAGGTAPNVNPYLIGLGGVLAVAGAVLLTLRYRRR
ncbi:MAG: aromatic amino acid lyase [Actinomycetota bacterium]|nr:aromatic amino acid lyase [Actinomycetota bacterium]